MPYIHVEIPGDVYNRYVAGARHYETDLMRYVSFRVGKVIKQRYQLQCSPNIPDYTQHSSATVRVRIPTPFYRTLQWRCTLHEAPIQAKDYVRELVKKAAPVGDEY